MYTLTFLWTLLGCPPDRSDKSDDSGTTPTGTTPPVTCVDEDADGWCAGEYGDCDDTDAAVNPLAQEVCNGPDDDCNGLADDADPGLTDARTWYTDADGDGFGDESTRVEACDAPDVAPGVAVSPGGDCDDAAANVHPDADEADCTDPTDYNCDGSVMAADADGDGYAACEDCDDGDVNAYPGRDPELCDGVDQDCDGQVDEDALDAEIAWEDLDGDGYGGGLSVLACGLSSGFAPLDGDCDDLVPTVNPAATEVCNALDDDCDARIDDDDLPVADTTAWYRDADADGFGLVTEQVDACGVPPGYVTDTTDCDDLEAGVNPDATEVCDGLVDEDCDGRIDDDDPSVTDAASWYPDDDGDGYGDEEDALVACVAPAGRSAKAGDCLDSNPEVSPEATEVCNAIDDDCDGELDEESADARTWYLDADGDGYGTSDQTHTACDAPPGYVADDNDCDDQSGARHPDATESCDGVDDDCDGEIDEQCDACEPPTRGDWVVTADCTVWTSLGLQGDLEVRSGAVLTVAAEGAVVLDLSAHRLLVESGSGVLIRQGGVVR